MLLAGLRMSHILTATTPVPGLTAPPGFNLSNGASLSGGTSQGSFGSAAAETAERCAQEGVTLCSVVHDLTGSVRVGAWAEVVLSTPVKVIGIILLGMLARFLLFRTIDRVTERVANGNGGLGRLERLPSATALLTTSPLLSARREQRARTMASVLKSTTTAAVGAVVVLMVMQTLYLPMGPLLASVSIIGVAVGFGAQSLVKDVIAGMFMIAEDQYGVGDVVSLGQANGVVEGVGLRVTRLRDVDGTVWYVRNGEVTQVGNRSQGWARAVLDVGIAYDEDVERAQTALLDTARELQRDPDLAGFVLDDPEVWGIESMSAQEIVLRLVVKTQPLQQWIVARDLRRRIKERFDADGIRCTNLPVAPPAGAGGNGAANGNGTGNGNGVTSR